MIEQTKFDQIIEIALQIDPLTLAKKEKDDSDKPDNKLGYTVDELGLAQLQVSGPITKYPSSYSSLFGGAASVEKQKALRDIGKDDRVKAVAMIYDSPGGTVAGTPEVGDEIMKLRKQKPVYAVVDGDAMSGAYWWASQCDYIFANPVAHVGSIGSTVRLYDFSKQMNRDGIVAVPIDSGKFKSLGMRGKEITEEDKAEIMRIVQVSKNLLFSAITNNRSVTAQELSDMEARVYVGQEAIDMGLIDEICHTDEALDKIRLSLSSGAGGRLLGNLREAAQSIADTPARSNDMGAFTPKQIEAFRTLIPSAAGVTDEKLPESVASFVTEQSAAVQRLTAENAELKTKLSDAKSKVPDRPDEKVAAGHIGVLQREIALSVREGKLLPTQAQVLTDTIMPNSKANADLVMGNGTIMLPASTVAKVIELNKPIGLTGEVTTGQTIDRVVPESQNEDPGKASVQTPEQKKALNERVAAHMGKRVKQPA